MVVPIRTGHVDKGWIRGTDVAETDKLGGYCCGCQEYYEEEISKGRGEDGDIEGVGENGDDGNQGETLLDDGDVAPNANVERIEITDNADENLEVIEIVEEAADADMNDEFTDPVKKSEVRSIEDHLEGENIDSVDSENKS